MWACGRGQTDTHTDTHTDTQTLVPTIHFASSTTHAKCNNGNILISNHSVVVVISWTSPQSDHIDARVGGCCQSALIWLGLLASWATRRKCPRTIRKPSKRCRSSVEGLMRRSVIPKSGCIRTTLYARCLQNGYQRQGYDHICESVWRCNKMVVPGEHILMCLLLLNPVIHTTPMLRCLHWLRITERIEYKLVNHSTSSLFNVIAENWLFISYHHCSTMSSSLRLKI